MTKNAKRFSQVDQWMSGDALMVTPILTSNDGQITDTQRSVYLPATIWHELRWSQGNFSFMASHKGPATISATGVQFTDMLLFGRAGGIVFMGPLLQYVCRAEYDDLSCCTICCFCCFARVCVRVTTSSCTRMRYLAAACSRLCSGLSRVICALS